MKNFLKNSVVGFVLGWMVACLVEILLKRYYVGVVDHRELREETAYWWEKVESTVENIKDQKGYVPDDLDVFGVRQAYDQVVDALMYPQASGVYVHLVTQNYYDEWCTFAWRVVKYYMKELDRMRRAQG